METIAKSSGEKLILDLEEVVRGLHEILELSGGSPFSDEDRVAMDGYHRLLDYSENGYLKDSIAKILPEVRKTIEAIIEDTDLYLENLSDGLTATDRQVLVIVKNDEGRDQVVQLTGLQWSDSRDSVKLVCGDETYAYGQYQTMLVPEPEKSELGVEE